MELEIARFLGNKDLLLNYFAQKSIVPVKSPPWADHPFGLRRNKKVKNREIGRLAGKKTMLLIMQALGEIVQPCSSELFSIRGKWQEG